MGEEKVTVKGKKRKGKERRDCHVRREHGRRKLTKIRKDGKKLIYKPQFANLVPVQPYNATYVQP